MRAEGLLGHLIFRLSGLYTGLQLAKTAWNKAYFVTVTILCNLLATVLDRETELSRYT